MSKADDALRDCFTAVKGNIANVPIDDVVLQMFVEKFRGDFETTFIGEPDAWMRDKQKVTTLARAIATFAEFLALTDIAVPGRVTYEHLKTAYLVLAPFCRPEGVALRRQYCTTAQP
jgi:hypothetical protein